MGRTQQSDLFIPACALPMAGDAGEQDPASSWADVVNAAGGPLHPLHPPSLKASFLPQQAQTDMGEPQGHRQGPGGWVCTAQLEF